MRGGALTVTAVLLLLLLLLVDGSRCSRFAVPASSSGSPPPSSSQQQQSSWHSASPSSLSSYRLPGATSPLGYDLRFEPTLSRAAFAGVARITVAVAHRTDVVTLNLVELDVTAVAVTEATVVEATYHADRQRLEIRVAAELQPGSTHLVTVEYHGRIRNDSTGLYLASYEQDNATKLMAVTDFQPAAARKAFPCYDEPQFKTRFNISVVRQKNQTVLSNMPIQRIEVGPDNSTEVVYFETTPPMSTYLVAFYIGEFEPSKSDANVTIYTRKEFSNQTEYVAASAPRLLRVMEEYTGIEYMLPKMDLLAVPDFNEGAMENWGMNTFKEKYLLMQRGSKTVMKMEAIQGVQHEFAHQWFGNLVTCSWWKHLWLNEGFATYFQYFATGMVWTEWPMEELFVLEVHQAALDYDQFPRRSISGTDNDNINLDVFFDSITYYKSASILRMLRHMVTEKLFQLSIRDYLNTFKESVAEPNDLYASFDRVLIDHNYTFGNELTVNEFMSNWTSQSGYPILHIKKNEATNMFSVTQSRFLMRGYVDGAWHVGLTYTTESSKDFGRTSPSVWTDKTSLTTVIPAPPNSGWYIFNLQSTGLYRVNYDINNWNALIRQLREAPEQIHVLNRAQLIDDAFALAKARQLDFEVPLNLTKYLKYENNSIPWYSAMIGFSFLLERMPRGDPLYVNLKEYVSELVGNMFMKIDDLVSSGHSDATVSRAWDEFGKLACRLDNVNCINRTMEYFKKWEAGEKISDDIKDAAFCVGVKRRNDSGTFDRMADLFKTTKSISEKSSAEEALHCTTNKTLLSEFYMHKSISSQSLIWEDDEASLVSTLFSLFKSLTKNVKKVLEDLFSVNGIADNIYSIVFAYTVKIDSYRMLLKTYSEEIGQWLRENRENDTY